MKLSVIIPTHNPDRERLGRTLEGLARQTLPRAFWEFLLVDNASASPLSREMISNVHPEHCNILHEPELGLSSARRCGFRNVTGELAVLVDDDNVLAPDYLEQVVKIFDEHPKLGAAGGRSLPEFQITPPPWIAEFIGLLACRELGAEAKIADGFKDESPKTYPPCAPIGAGMAIRKVALAAWMQEASADKFSDRRGHELTSGGDNDIIFTILESGWDVGYFPELSLAHLISASRLQPEYLAKLNRGIAKSWMQVLAKHQCNPWPPIPRWTVPLRKLKAWFAYRAWAGSAERIRWAGACGHFEGRANTPQYIPNHVFY